MKTCHLFAGGGGGILADLILGHKPIYAIESNSYACDILRERFPTVHVIESDIREVDFSLLAGVDAICAGFPCQDISAAGTGAGLGGERSGLFYEVIRAIDTIEPEYVFLENSPRIRTRGRDIVITELVARGYAWRDGILGAADVGAPHQRDRWWLLARRTDANGMRELRQAPAHPQSPRLSERKAESASAFAGSQCRYPARGWWTTEPGLGRMAHGVANRPHRIRLLGNGQVPLAAALAWRLLGGP